MKVKISDLSPNPYRDMTRYPIDRKKIDALKESFDATGFWENIVGRKNGGKVQIAYGHHRILALTEAYGEDYQFNLIIKPLSDAAMLQMMARENMDVYHGSAAIEQETVRSVLTALADGDIELPVPDKGKSQHVSDFILATGGQNDPEVSSRSLAEFTGLTKNKVQVALKSLKAMLEGEIRETDIDGVTSEQAERIVREVRKTPKKKKRKVAETLKEGFIAGEVSKRTASKVAREIRQENTSQPPADINDVCESLRKKLYTVFRDDKDIATQLNELVKYREYLDAHQRNELVKRLELTGETVLNFATALSGQPVEMKLIGGDS